MESIEMYIENRNKHERLRDYVERQYGPFMKEDMQGMVLFCGGILALTTSIIVSSGLERLLK